MNNIQTIIAIEVNEETYKRLKEESSDYSKTFTTLASICSARIILNKNLETKYKIIYR